MFNQLFFLKNIANIFVLIY